MFTLLSQLVQVSTGHLQIDLRGGVFGSQGVEIILNSLWR